MCPSRNLKVVSRTRWRVIVIGALLLAALGVTGFVALRGSSAPAAALPLGSPIGAVFHRPIELVGACNEARIDHGHDVDPPGLIDQENDECLPAQHAKRASDGRLIG